MRLLKSTFLARVVLPVLLIIAAFLPVTAIQHPAAAAAGWWNDSWGWRADAVVKNNVNSDLTDYQVKVNVPYRSDMKPDFGDIRFIASDGMTELSFWMESFTAGSSAVFWVKLPRIPALGISTFYIYFSNPAVTTTSNIHTAFIWGDDFENTAWTAANIHQVNFGGSSQNIQNGQYHMLGPTASEPIAEIYSANSLKQFPGSYILEAAAATVSGTGGAYITPRYSNVNYKYESQVDFQGKLVLCNRVVNGAWTNLALAGLKSTVRTGELAKLTATTIREGNTNRLQVSVNDALYDDVTDASLSYNGLAFLAYDWNDPFHIIYDNVRVRQYASKEPAVITGFGGY